MMDRPPIEELAGVHEAGFEITGNHMDSLFAYIRHLEAAIASEDLEALHAIAVSLSTDLKG